MRSEEVWRLSLAQYSALADAYDDELRMQDLLLASTKLIIAEPNRDKERHPTPFKVEDFLVFPEKVEEDKRSNRKEMTWQEQLVYTQQFLQPFFTSRANLEQKQRELRGY